MIIIASICLNTITVEYCSLRSMSSLNWNIFSDIRIQLQNDIKKVRDYLFTNITWYCMYLRQSRNIIDTIAFCNLTYCFSLNMLKYHSKSMLNNSTIRLYFNASMYNHCTYYVFKLGFLKNVRRNFCKYYLRKSLYKVLENK